MSSNCLDSIVIQQAGQRPDRLILLFHGVGSSPESMLPLGHRLAAEFAHATVVSVASPFASDISAGYQWFSVQGVTEKNRVERVATAMTTFLAEVRSWQEREDATASTTVLVGFSQGAVMALEATSKHPSPAARVVAIAGRFAALPAETAQHTSLHLLHGKLDAVISYRFAVETAQCLLGIGGDVTVDVLPFVGHEINVDIIELTVRHLQSHVPKVLWEEALSVKTNKA